MPPLQHKTSGRLASGAAKWAVTGGLMGRSVIGMDWVEKSHVLWTSEQPAENTRYCRRESV